MKKNIIISIGLLLSGFSYSQVGINTSNPQGIFNIDGAKDNPTTGSTYTAQQQLNDFTVLVNGNVGIGTINPTQKLEIQTGGTVATPVTGFKLTDGNQGDVKVLTSDANGVGTWKPITVPSIKGSFVNVATGRALPDKNVSGKPFVYSGASITLTPGTWAVNLGLTIQTNMTGNKRVWMHTYSSSSNINRDAMENVGFSTNLQGGNVLASGNVFGSPDATTGMHNYSMLQGANVFTVPAGSSPVTIYFWFDNTNEVSQYWEFSAGNWENYLFATRVNLTN